MSTENKQFWRLLIELSRLGTSSSDLDKVLQRLLPQLGFHFGENLLNRGAILLYGKDGRLWPVAQHGFGSSRDTLSLWSASARMRQEIRADVHTAQWDKLFGQSFHGSVPASLLVLPMKGEEEPLGVMLIFARANWQPEGNEKENLDDLARVASSVVMRCLANETLRMREKELEDARVDAIHRLGAASEYRDCETGMHLMRMTQYAGAIGKMLGLTHEQSETLQIVAPMHDVGKIGIQDAILLKPGRLTVEEFDTMKRHTEIGAQLLKGEDELIAAAREVAEHHHEHWDGSGYPHGLSGDAIPLFARICTVADVFDALTTKRPYKTPWSLDESIDWIRNQSGKKFDPEVVRAFESALPMILRIRDLYRDDVLDPWQAIELPEPEPSDSRFIVWDDSLSIGIDIIDLHHLYLVDLINHLHDVVVRKQGARKVAVVVQSLSTYAHVHFNAEEKMMLHHGYAGLHGQQHSHRHFRQQIEAFSRSLHTNPITTPMELLEYLRHWFLNHIRHEDANLRQIIDGTHPASPALPAALKQAALHRSSSRWDRIRHEIH